ncbi:hypothetical protein FRAAL3245 [Frankia alni ACN14a]|uniref:Uncharacterized protein n=1 Tax=Frankia alni (strain DSM 45986 / CECT 9034 / ACN14a) TaxID=326424 RepID=Q0RKR6_FRAAA|nr:hypothetical protein FRAAL3245 [Frankia alni ACN14a]
MRQGFLHSRGNSPSGHGRSRHSIRTSFCRKTNDHLIVKLAVFLSAAAGRSALGLTAEQVHIQRPHTS